MNSDRRGRTRDENITWKNTTFSSIRQTVDMVRSEDPLKTAFFFSWTSLVLQAIREASWEGLHEILDLILLGTVEPLSPLFCLAPEERSLAFFGAALGLFPQVPLQQRPNVFDRVQGCGI